MMHKQLFSSRGFTLIELLIVIAILGFLAVMALGSFTGALEKGRDSSIQGSLTSARTKAQLFYGSENKFNYKPTTGDDVCTANSSDTRPGLAEIITAVEGLSPSGATEVVCNATATEWAAGAQLNEDITTYFCVDSTGFAGVVEATTKTPTAKPVSGTGTNDLGSKTKCPR